MLDFQVQQYPFRLGLAEGQDPHQVPPGTLVTAENAVWRQGGRLEKRFGLAALVATILGGGSIAACSRLFTRGTELCLIDGTNLYAYSSAMASWKSAGLVPNLGATWSTILDATTGVQGTDAAIASGLLVHAWVSGDPAAPTSVATSGALFVQVMDLASGTVLLPPTKVDASAYSGVRVMIIGTTAIVLSRATNNLTAHTVNLSTMAVSAATNLRTDMLAVGAYEGFDACIIGSNFVVAYNATGTLLKLYSYNSSLAQQATGGITSEVGGCRMIGIDGASGETLYVCYSRGTGNGDVYFAAANPSTLAQTVAPVLVEATATAGTQAVSVCRYDSTNCVVAYTMLDTLATTRAVTAKVSSAGTISTTSVRGTYDTCLASRPFMFGGRCYAVLSDYPVLGFRGVNTQVVEAETSTNGGSTYVPHRYVASLDLLVGGRIAASMCLPTVAVSASTSIYVTVPFQASVVSSNTNWRQGVRLVNITSGASMPRDIWRASLGGAEAYISGGVLNAYDGSAAFDYGFSRGPAFYAVTNSAAGGSIAAGSYLYAAALEYRSFAGVLHRSGTNAAPSTYVTTGATSKLTIDFVGGNLSTKQNLATGFGSNRPILTAVYRTIANGATYQRLTFEPGFNIPNTDSNNELIMLQTLADTRADASIDGAGTALASRPAIYTTGGILDDYAPPASVTIFHHADRLWVLAGDQRTWWYSKAFQDDAGVAPGFHPNFRVIFDTTQVAGATMDDKAIFFAADGVRYMLGTGPAPNGQNSDFATPTAIQSDVGCNNARSVVGTPDGVMFGSDRGIYLLTRGLELVWIGRPVKDTLAAYPTITSAVLVPKQNQVRFTATNVAGTGSLVLVYDYVEKQWSTFKYWVGGSYGGLIADACMWNGAYTIASAAGAVYTESTATYLDDAHYVQMTLETAWISSAGPLAFQSVRNFGIHGTSYTDHDLTISVGFDSDTSYPQVATWAATSAVTAVGDEEASVTIGTRRKCSNIRFKIVDSTPTAGSAGIGRGPVWDMMGIEVGTKRGFKTTPATKRA